MLHVRIVVPAAQAARVLDLLERDPAVASVVHLEGVARKPAGDVVLCDVAREDASALLEDLRRLGVERDGSVAVDSVDVTISAAADRAEAAARGSPSDAVLWEEVEARTSESTELSWSFVAFMVLATLIAGAGILTDSLILIIGAMVVGPEFGPVAGLSVAVVQRRLRLARRSALALAAGFPLAIAATTLGTLLVRAVDIAPARLALKETLFISHPNWWSAIVALLAGVAGVLSLSAAKSGALVGVLISVTTIPAAGNVGVALAYGHWSDVGGAAAQLAINLAALVAAGVATLAVQREAYARRLVRRRRRSPDP